MNVALVANICGARYEEETRIGLTRRVRHIGGCAARLHGHVDCVVTLPGGERVYIELDRAEKTWSRRKLVYCARVLGGVALWIRWRGRVRMPHPTHTTATRHTAADPEKWGAGCSPYSGVCVVDMGDGNRRLRVLGNMMRANGGLRRGLAARTIARVGHWRKLMPMPLFLRAMAPRAQASVSDAELFAVRGPSPPA